MVRKINRLSTTFRGLFGVGVVLALSSLFLEIYSVTVIDASGSAIETWIYSIFSGWSNAYKPRSLISVPLIVVYTFIGTSIGSLVISLVKPVDRASDQKQLSALGYIFLFYLLLLGYLVVAFPLLNLVSQGFYFPFFVVINETGETITKYSVGTGYVTFIVSFLTCFPYAVYYFNASRRYDFSEPFDTQFERFVDKQKVPIDFERLVAEEKIKTDDEREYTNFNKRRRMTFGVP